jgi:membrane protein required for colicin V production
MQNFPINPVDMAVFGVLLLAALLAFTRGMVAEVVSLAAWGGAAVVTMYILPYALPVAQKYIHQDTLAYAAAAVATYILSLFALSTIGRGLARGVQNSPLSALDRSLGFVFGLFKGSVLVSVAYLFFAWLVPPSDYPKALLEARTQPFLAEGADLLFSLVPPSFRAEGLGYIDAARHKASEARELNEQLKRLSTTVPAGSKSSAPTGETGYKERDRGDLERLIQNAR